MEYQKMKNINYKNRRGLQYQLKKTDKFFIKEEQPKNFNKEHYACGFEKLWVWQKAFKLLQEIHKFCKTLPKDEKFKIRDQIERSSSSVCNNIAEGYSSYYYDEKIKGFNVARKEAGETQNHIRKIIDKCYLDEEIGKNWIKEYEEVIRGINGFIKYIRKKKVKNDYSP
uniref:Four helix bundle protein n=1 Tax=candidate division WOR-3 bacterium TaxID=2052148 RepID=A0A7V1EIU9_UNCW3